MLYKYVSTIENINSKATNLKSKFDTMVVDNDNIKSLKFYTFE
jgi:hypothetical protein